MSEDTTSGYVPGSVVWVPWSIARPDRRRRDEGRRESWLKRLFPPRRLRLYQRCLAIRVIPSGKADATLSPS